MKYYFSNTLNKLKDKHILIIYVVRMSYFLYEKSLKTYVRLFLLILPYFINSVGAASK